MGRIRGRAAFSLRRSQVSRGGGIQWRGIQRWRQDGFRVRSVQEVSVAQVWVFIRSFSVRSVVSGGAGSFSVWSTVSGSMVSCGARLTVSDGLVSGSARSMVWRAPAWGVRAMGLTFPCACGGECMHACVRGRGRFVLAILACALLPSAHVVVIGLG